MRLFPLLLLVSFVTGAPAAGPLRVLYLGQEGSPSAPHCAGLMRGLGRDAIWFDYEDQPANADAQRLGLYDAVVLEAPAAAFTSLAQIKPEKIVTPRFAAPEAEAKETEAMKEEVLKAAGPQRRAEWEAFLAAREPEVREPNPNVANYEKRPAPIGFQHSLSVKGSMERTQVPADFHLELFASEPQITKPIALAWDERGRLWIAETRDYPHGVTPDGEGNDDIKICEDTDGDGKADKFTVFADHLNLPTSLTFAHGGVIVTQPPRLLFLKSTKGDDHADVREVLIDGWGIKDTHAQASNLHYRLNNQVYGCVGYSGFKGTVGGKLMEFAMGTFRFRPDGSSLEFLHQFSNNSWGESQNAAGDEFGGTANNAPLFYGGIPASVVPAGLRVMTAKKINVEEKVHAITPNFRQVDVFGGYTAAAGSSFIESRNLPPRLQGMAMVCEPTMKVVTLMNVQGEGAGYVAKDGFNLVASTDEWMSPVCAETGPDGAVWVADWENFIIQHNPTPSMERGGYQATTGPGGAHENPLRDHALGRIYRVVWKGAQKPALTTLAQASTAQLVEALKSDTQFWRLTAQRLLVEGKKADAAPALKALVAAGDGSLGAVHALWALHGLGLLDAATHQAALAAKDPVLRRNAIRALSPDAAGQKLFFASGAIADPEPHTHLAGLVKLCEFPAAPELKSVVQQLHSDPSLQSDEWMSEALKVLGVKQGADAWQEGPNLLPNASFETVGADGLPEGWRRRDYGQQPGNADAQWEVLTGAETAHTGTHAVRCITRAGGDTSLFATVALKPNTQYRLSAWIKTHAFRGKASLNDHIGRAETEKVTERESPWVLVKTEFSAKTHPQASINLLHVAVGDSFFDDVKLCELVPRSDTERLAAGDAKRGEEVFYKHTIACVLCHSLKGQGSTVGPPLDGIATRGTPAYIRESLLEPNKVLAKGYENLGVSPMPPMGVVLKPQELEDVQAFLQTLK